MFQILLFQNIVSDCLNNRLAEKIEELGENVVGRGAGGGGIYCW